MYYKNRKFNIPNNVFTFKDIQNCNSAFSKGRIFQILRQKVMQNELIKIKHGIYKLNTDNNISNGLNTTFDFVKNKYIVNNKSVYGYISGIYLLNTFGLTTQVPNTLEITTNNESTRGRFVAFGNQKFYLKKSKFKINSNNVKILQFISLISTINILDYQDNISLIKQYVKENKIKRKTIYPYIKSLNKKAITNLFYLEI